MASFSISFRIADKTIAGRDWNTRYQDLIDAVSAISSGTHWDETTSFIAVQTNLDIDNVAARCRAVIAQTADLVLILDNDKQSARITGHNADPDIHALIPYLKKC